MSKYDSILIGWLVEDRDKKIICTNIVFHLPNRRELFITIVESDVDHFTLIIIIIQT